MKFKFSIIMLILIIICSNVSIAQTITPINAPVNVQTIAPTNLTLAQAQALAIKTWGLQAWMSPLSFPTTNWRVLFCVGSQAIQPATIKNPFREGLPNPFAGQPMVQYPGNWPEISWKGCGDSYTAAYKAANIPMGLTAAFVAAVLNPADPMTVTFNATLAVCDVKPCTYNWTASYDNSQMGTGITMNYSFQDIGIKKVRLTVIDGISRSVMIEHDITIQ